MPTKAIIGMILQSKYPPDIRVEKEVKALIKEGYEIHILCHKEMSRPAKETLQKLTIHRLVPSGNSALQRLNTVRFYLTLRNHVWGRYMYEWAKENNITILHVHDLPLTKTALYVMKRVPNMKLVLDLHENYPAGLQVWRKKDLGLKAKIWRKLHNYKRWLEYEKQAVQQADIVITVVEEMKLRLVQVHHLNPEKVYVVSNKEGKDFVANGKIDSVLIERYKDDFTLLYIGGFGPHRGVETAIYAMDKLRGYSIKLLLVGKGNPGYEEHMKTMINDLELSDSIELCGWQPFEKVYSYMRASSVGLVPHNSNEHTDNTIPHKLFQYMMTRLPVIVSDCPPLRRTVQELNSGLVFKAGDSMDFSEKVLELFNNKDKRDRLRENGYLGTMKGKDNWENESIKLVDAYRGLCNGTPREGAEPDILRQR